MLLPKLFTELIDNLMLGEKDSPNILENAMLKMLTLKYPP
jgi:hypothetical protein